MSESSVGEAIGVAVASAGVTHVFGLLGSGNFIIGATLAASGAEFHSSRHESGAVSMADGYARATGKVGVCTVHHGPGLTNSLTSLTEARKSSTPLLLITAAVAEADPWSSFWIDQIAVLRALEIHVRVVHTPADAVSEALLALHQAEVQQRPVVLVVPTDVQQASAPQSAPWFTTLRDRRRPLDDEELSELADLVAASTRPVLLAGRGAARADARDVIARLSQRIGALLVTSAGAMSLFAGDPSNAGLAGGFASDETKRDLHSADLVIAFGASLNPWTMHHGQLLNPRCVVAQIDLDRSALGRQYPIDRAIHGDAREVAEALERMLSTRGFRGRGFTDRMAEAARDRASDDAVGSGFSDLIDPRVLSSELDRRLPSERTVVVDSGLFMPFPVTYLTAPDPQGFLFPQAFMSVGLGLGTAIGAAIGRPDRVAVAALGDGGALMSLPELETAARLELPMIILIYNDAAYGAEVYDFAGNEAAVGLVRFPPTDFAAVARSLGAVGEAVRKASDLDCVDEWLACRDRPLVIDAKIDPKVVSDRWL